MFGIAALGTSMFTALTYRACVLSAGECAAAIVVRRRLHQRAGKLTAHLAGAASDAETGAAVG